MLSLLVCVPASRAAALGGRTEGLIAKKVLHINLWDLC